MIPSAKLNPFATPHPICMPAARAALELQGTQAAGAPAGPPRFDVPFSELHGTFADLVQQLQQCVDWRRSGE